MIKRLINTIKIIMRFDFQFHLIFYIDHDMNCNEMYDNVELNIEKLKTRYYIFVIVHANHQFVFD
jgi:hypothetical protein